MNKHDNLSSAAGRSARQGQDGFAILIALIATVIPLLLIMGASSITMTSRLSRLERESKDERALAACESGIDLAIYMASTPTGLTSGSVVTRNLGGGLSFTLRPTFLKTDGRNNDPWEDNLIDEADENIYQVEVTGAYRSTRRRIVAYLGPEPPLPFTVTGAVMMTDAPAAGDLQVFGASRIRGINYGLNGLPTGSGDAAGISVLVPDTVAELLTAIPPGDRPNVLGATPAPSLSTTAQTIDLNSIQLSIQNSANVVLTNNSYNNFQFGNSSLGQYKIIYRAGNVIFKGNSRGAGVMFITGNLEVQGGFLFDGVIYVLGDVNMHGTQAFYGAVITGPDTDHFEVGGTQQLRYSSQAITQATAVLPTKYLVFNGWQELARP